MSSESNPDPQRVAHVACETSVSKAGNVTEKLFKQTKVEMRKQVAQGVVVG